MKKFLIRLSLLITTPCATILCIPYFILTGKDLLSMFFDFYTEKLK